MSARDCETIEWAPKPTGHVLLKAVLVYGLRSYKYHHTHLKLYYYTTVAATVAPPSSQHLNLGGGLKLGLGGVHHW